MRVAIYINIMERGGAEGQVILLARGLLERGYDVKIATGSGKLAVVPEELLPHIVQIPERPRVKRFLLFFRFLREYRPDILHNQLYMANVFGTLAGRLAGVPVVIMSVLSTDLWKRRAARFLEKTAAAFASKVMVNSQQVADDLSMKSRIPDDSIKVIYNGVDTDCFSPENRALNLQKIREELNIPVNTPLIINVANLLPVKNHAALLRALSLLHSELPVGQRPYLLLCGEGPEKENIVRYAGELGILSFIRMTGWVDEIERYLAASDIFCLSSKSEGFPNAIIEAMATGIPCVVTDVGGNREGVIDGENGYVVPNDDGEAISARLLELIANPEKARRMGNSGREIAQERFSLERMISDTIRLYENGTNGKIVRN